VLGSIANYLARLGWRGNESWGREVAVPGNFDTRLAGLESRRPLADWMRMGVRSVGAPLTGREAAEASLLLPDGLGGRAYPRDRFGDTAGPWVAVPGHDPAGLDVLDASERLERSRCVRGERGEARAVRTGGDGVGGERVPDEECVARRDMEGRASGGMPGRQDHPWAAGDVECGAVAERGHLTDMSRPQPPANEREP
jgi:hypothetical protein